jgi:nitrite reductase/ring-hydroxylating ferredoxin subunit/DMSO/TMAO reductase YedYZ heme-binding membrane subunit
MSERYQAVLWNPQKKTYDRTIAFGVVLYLLVFVGLGFGLYPDTTAETILIRALGSAALVLLHIILCIGPLTRLDSRFLPLLYNRRHLGVTMFLLGAAHGIFGTIQFHALGDANPLVSMLSANPRIDSVSQFPFEPFGFLALIILFLLAATSHDFWLRNLTAPVWKVLHMGVYLAYASVVVHVALGSGQGSVGLRAVVGLGVVLVAGLHTAAAMRSREGDASPGVSDGWADACAVSDLRENRGHIVTVAGERVAIFLYEGSVSAISNVCQHQNGPLGEGRIIDGCVTCPWHGYQYDPATGRSPAPFTERIPTFGVEVRGDRVWVNAIPNPAGTEVAPARIGAAHAG